MLFLPNAKTAIPAAILLIMLLTPFGGEWIADRFEDFIHTYPKVCAALWWGTAAICITVLLCAMLGCRAVPKRWSATERCHKMTMEELVATQEPYFK